jgi:ParB family transcriptional regulator, chromosome partitioning protein
MPDIALSLIWVKRDSRQRRKLEPDPALQQSIKRVGLINPIILTKDYQLIAGERRWEACKALGMQTISVRWVDDLNIDELKVIELEENIKRKDLTWQDSVRAIAELHYLYGKNDPAWNQRMTAEALSIDAGHVSNTLLVATHLKDPKVAKATSVNEARNLIRRRKEREDETEINDMAIFAREMVVSGTDKPSPILHNIVTPQAQAEASPKPVVEAPWSRSSVERAIRQENFLEWAPSYTGMSFNLIHCDFPYGANVFDGAGQFKPEDQEGAYSDQAADYWTLTECLIKNLDHLLSPLGHIMFWLSPKPAVMLKTMRLFELQGPSIEFYPYPLIWHKSDNSGIVGDSQRWPRHTYEAALLAYRGRRPLVKTVADSYSGPGDRKLHPSCKPEPMLRHFFGSLVDGNTRFLDPTCGAASSLRAAESLGALPQNVLGLEIEERFVSVGRESLLSFRVNAEAHDLTLHHAKRDAGS